MALPLFSLLVVAACTMQKQPPQVRYGQPEQAKPSQYHTYPSPKPRTNGQLRKQNYPSLKPDPYDTYTHPGAPVDETRSEKLRDASGALANAATSPLKDLNIIHPKAPETLANLGYIYQLSTRPTCAQIARELYVLDQALQEPDADDEIIAQTKAQKRKKLASETTLDAISDTASSLIPFSGVVKTASGARAAEKRYNEQFDHGRRRRAFLKGYALGIGCPPPISPRTLTGPLPIKLPPDEETRNEPYREVRHRRPR